MNKTKAMNDFKLKLQVVDYAQALNYNKFGDKNKFRKSLYAIGFKKSDLKKIMVTKLALCSGE